jgi:hypothetical protein
MVVNDNKLYVCGDFSEIGGVESENVAVWDGTSWSSLTLSDPFGYVNAIEVYDGQLYAGIFANDEAHLYRTDAPSAVREIDPVNDVRVQVIPNPVGDRMTILTPPTEQAMFIEILDALGRVIDAQMITGESVEFNCTSWPQGTYVVRVYRDDDRKTVSSQSVIRL